MSFKSLGASSVGLPIAECNMTVTRQLQPFIVVLSFMFGNLSELKSGKECDGFVTLVSGADFRRDDRCFISFLNSEALCFFPF